MNGGTSQNIFHQTSGRLPMSKTLYNAGFCTSFDSTNSQ